MWDEVNGISKEEKKVATLAAGAADGQTGGEWEDVDDVAVDNDDAEMKAADDTGLSASGPAPLADLVGQDTSLADADADEVDKIS